MARFTSAMLSMTTTNLRRIAIALKAGVEAKSNYRRTFSVFSASTTSTQRRSGAFFCVCSRRRLPTRWSSTERSGISARCLSGVLAQVGIAHQGMAFPVIWNALPDAGSSGSDVQRRLFDRFLSVVDPEDIEVVMADREFISMRWLRHLRERGVSFCVRLRSDRRVGLGPEGQEAAFPARTHARMQSEVGEEPRVLCGQRYLFGSGEAGEALPQARVVVRRIGADASSGDQFLILATSGIDPEEATRLYQRRWEIETMFAALKSRGFDLEETHLTAPDRIERLIGLLALAFTCGALGRPEARRSLRSTAYQEVARTPRAQPLSLRTGLAPGAS